MSRSTWTSATRRPLAAAQRAVAYQPARAEALPALFTVDGQVDVHALHALLSAAEVAIEGGRYDDAGPVETFVGSATFELSLPTPRASRAALAQDPRAAQALQDHTRRHLASLLGAEMPPRLTFDIAIRVVDEQLRVTVDFEGPLAPGAVAHGS